MKQTTAIKAIENCLEIIFESRFTVTGATVVPVSDAITDLRKLLSQLNDGTCSIVTDDEVDGSGYNV